MFQGGVVCLFVCHFCFGGVGWWFGGFVWFLGFVLVCGGGFFFPQYAG